MQISVVIPTFKRPALLLRCLDALLNQTLSAEDYEIIVVTDGADPATIDAVDHLTMQSPSIRVLQLDRKKGPAAARNKGWQAAEAELIAFTDDDTIPDQCWLQSLVHHHLGSMLVAYTGRTIVPVSDQPTDYELNTRGLETAEFITANCCITRQALELVNGFDERFSLAWREDSNLHFKLMTHDVPIMKVSTAIVIHPIRNAGWGVSIREQRKGMFNALLYKKHKKLYRQRIQPSPGWNYYGMIAAVIIGLVALFMGSPRVTIVAFGTWTLLFVLFVRKRLQNTTRSWGHVNEMIVTSALIPMLSVYWQLYGAVKYRAFFL